MARKSRNIERLPGKIKDYLKDYEYVPDIFTKDEKDVIILKKVIQDLSDVDRIVLLLYVELQSLTEVSKILGVSRSTVYWEEKRIKNLVLDRFREYKGRLDDKI